ncbi:MAG: Holliday junction branch migration protein RuvA [Deltaproteobacteria bacterium]|nr:Holliday junction branch migration protein RuvA [Deltaproteobacteria bacterium]
MIASLSGLVETKGLDEAVIDVNGVGYRVHLSLRSLARLPPAGQRARLHIRTVVREDALDLYGFATPDEEELFLMLTSVSSIGPRTAMTILSGMEPTELARAIASNDLPRLTKLHGVGKKTAERLVVELKDKVKPMLIAAPALAAAAGGSLPGGLSSDLVSALVNLGYKEAQAEKAAEAATLKLGADAALDSLIREALRAARS